jgi:hypothetical protein
MELLLVRERRTLARLAERPVCRVAGVGATF